jgi:hypothetical protein
MDFLCPPRLKTLPLPLFNLKPGSVSPPETFCLRAGLSPSLASGQIPVLEARLLPKIKHRPAGEGSNYAKSLTLPAKSCILAMCQTCLARVRLFTNRLTIKGRVPPIIQTVLLSGMRSKAPDFLLNRRPKPS